MKSTTLWIALLFCVTRGAQAQSSPFSGDWTNPDPEGGLTRLIVSEQSGAWSIQAWGKCHPTDCD